VFWKKQFVFAALLPLLASFCLVCFGYPLQPLRLRQLVDASDVIAIADVTVAEGAGRINVDVDGNTLEAVPYQADVQPIRFLKGSGPQHIAVSFFTPLEYVGYPGVASSRQMVFLKFRDGLYSFVDPHYPTLPVTASADVGAPATDPLEGVIIELGKVLASPSEPAGKKWQVMSIAYALRSFPIYMSYLRAAVTAANQPDLKYRIQAELITRDDLTDLPTVGDLLLKGGLTDRQREMFLSAISNVLKDPRALPTLRRLLSSETLSVRRAAAEAMWHIGDPSEIKDLLRLLSDEDDRIRFCAVRGLAIAVNEPSWGPSPGEFEEHEDKYIQHWLEWAQARSQP
jgi:hypothetical protein